MTATYPRAKLLDQASDDTIRWLSGPDEKVLGKPSDQFWLRLFASAYEITPADAHKFLVTFQLTNRVKWDKERVAELIRGLVYSEHMEPIVAIPALAEDLRAANARGTKQTSAASKLATFAKPFQPIFIWDNLARRSAANRLKLTNRIGRPVRNPFVSNSGEHDYAAYYTASEETFAEELSRPDFLEKLDAVIQNVRSVDGPLSRASDIPDEFIARRFLDKLMFWEGWTILNRELPD